MIDTHLFYLALTALGIGVGAALLIAAAIIAVSAVLAHRTAPAGTELGVRTGGHSLRLRRHVPALR